MAISFVRHSSTLALFFSVPTLRSFCHFIFIAHLVWRFCFSFMAYKSILAWLCPRLIFHILSCRLFPFHFLHTMIFLLTPLFVVHNYVFFILVNVNCFLLFYSHWGQHSGLVCSFQLAVVFCRLRIIGDCESFSSFSFIFTLFGLLFLCFCVDFVSWKFGIRHLCQLIDVFSFSSCCGWRHFLFLRLLSLLMYTLL